MWPFRRNSLADVVLGGDFTDYHCHLLPGVDDGARTMEESLCLLGLYEQWGIQEVWLTPHVMEDMPNSVEGLQQRFAELREAYQGTIRLHLAAEHMLDNLFEERLSKKSLLPIGEEGRHLLVETSYFNPPMAMEGILERIQSAGYQPVLAHPERYVYMDEQDYLRLRELRVDFQLNLFSLVGAYGTEARKKAEWLLKQDFYSLMGSDMHRQALSNPDLWKQKIGGKVAEQLRVMKISKGRI